MGGMSGGGGGIGGKGGGVLKDPYLLDIFQVWRPRFSDFV